MGSIPNSLCNQLGIVMSYVHQKEYPSTRAKTAEALFVGVIFLAVVLSHIGWNSL
jgi:hypothetical protein